MWATLQEIRTFEAVCYNYPVTPLTFTYPLGRFLTVPAIAH